MKKSSKTPIIKPGQTKSDKIIPLLQRNTGATISELAKVTAYHVEVALLAGLLLVGPAK